MYISYAYALCTHTSDAYITHMQFKKQGKWDEGKRK